MRWHLFPGDLLQSYKLIYLQPESFLAASRPLVQPLLDISGEMPHSSHTQAGDMAMSHHLFCLKCAPAHVLSAFIHCMAAPLVGTSELPLILPPCPSLKIVNHWALLLSSHCRVQLCNRITAGCQASCPSLSPRVCSNSCPLSRWCHPTMSSCHLLLLLPSVFPSIRVFSTELCRLISEYPFVLSLGPGRGSHYSVLTWAVRACSCVLLFLYSPINSTHQSNISEEEPNRVSPCP